MNPIRLRKNRKLIDSIEAKIEQGIPVNEAVQLAMKKVGEVNLETGEMDITKVKYGKGSLKIQGKSKSAIDKNKFPLISPRNLDADELEKKRSMFGLNVEKRAVSQALTRNISNPREEVYKVKDLQTLKEPPKLGTHTRSASLQGILTKSPSENEPKKLKEVLFAGLHEYKNSTDRMNDGSEQLSPQDLSISISEESATNNLRVSDGAMSSLAVESKLASKGEKVTKSTSNNIKQVIQEVDESDESEEDEKAQEQREQNEHQDSDSPSLVNHERSSSQANFVKNNQNESVEVDEYFGDDIDKDSSGNKIWDFIKSSS